MYREPVLNDPDHPLTSVLVYNYDGKCLRECLECVFTQDALPNIEVVYVDDATCDGSWELAVEYAERKSPFVTLSRNRRALGPEQNLHQARKLARGRYATVLTGEAVFRPLYVRSCVEALQKDPHVQFSTVHRVLGMDPEPCGAGERGPLVSILCYNFNYGRFLCRSLKSVLSQTYENIEVCFSDNGSSDDSWRIALDFAKRYPQKMSLTRNRRNFGVDANFANCCRMMKGKYYINFCSDDVMEPMYVARCVEVLEAHPNAGMAIVNRALLDSEDCRTEEPPFYNQSCIIRGEEQAAVYMLAGVNPSVSQIMYRRDVADGRSATGALVARYYGTRILDFKISLDYDVAYIKDNLLLHRIHDCSDTSRAERDLLPVIGTYVLNHQLADLASLHPLDKVTSRLPQSLENLASLAIRYCARSLMGEDEHTALKYFYLAIAINPKIVEDSAWQQLQDYWTADAHTKTAIVSKLRARQNLVSRSVSYDPPPGSISIA